MEDKWRRLILDGGEVDGVGGGGGGVDVDVDVDVDDGTGTAFVLLHFVE